MYIQYIQIWEVFLKMIRKILSIATIGLVASGVFAESAMAEFPEKPVTIIVPYAPGGATDVLVRLTAKHLEPALGQTIAIKNISGAGGSLGMFEATQARPDGYTLGMYLTNTEIAMATGTAAFTSDNLVPVALLGEMYLTVASKGGGSYESLADLRVAAESKPGEISIGMGQGTLANFAAGMVESAMGVDFKLVNVGGGAKKKAATLGGHVDTMVEPTLGVQGSYNGGELNILAVLAPDRVKSLPDVPTAREQGFDIISVQANGFFAPKGTPAEVINTIADAVEKLSYDEEYQKSLQDLSFVWRYEDSKAFGAYMNDLNVKINQVAQDLNLAK